MKKPVLVAAFILTALTFWALLRTTESPAPAPAPAAVVELADAPLALTVEGAVIERPVEEIVPLPEEVRPEETTVEPVAYFPPPSVNLSGGTLGRQVVPGTERAGDVSQLYFSDRDQALFAAVTEKDGKRAIWRLDQHGRFERVFAADDSPGEVRIMGDGFGTMYVMLNEPARVYRTADSFKTWREVMKGRGFFWGMAADGKGNVYGTLHSYNDPILMRSQDNGFTWEDWVDFRTVSPKDAVPYADGDDRNRLRHLHDVIYNDKTDSLIVGTGDVARYALQSDDNGATWRKIWDEGFTAHVPVSGGSRYLLCPDKLRGPGIALYDAWAKTVTETFSPGTHGFAGYCYSIVNVDGIYYAALHTEANEVDSIVPKSGIVTSPDGVTWYPFLEWDPLTNHARTDIRLVSAPGRVYAAINGRLYAFSPLTKDWFIDKQAFR